MLVLSRKIQEIIFVGEDIKICVLGLDEMSVRFGISAPRHIPIHRSELFTKMMTQKIKNMNNQSVQPDIYHRAW